MGRNSKHQQGFAVTQIVMIVVVVMLVGLVGFLVYKRQSGSGANNSLTTQEDVSKTESELKKQQEQLDKDIESDVNKLDETAENAL